MYIHINIRLYIYIDIYIYIYISYVIYVSCNDIHKHVYTCREIEIERQRETELNRLPTVGALIHPLFVAVAHDSLEICLQTSVPQP